MVALWIVSNLVLWGAALGLGFLLVGALRALRAWTWRLEQLEVALSGRLGLSPGATAPAFVLRGVQGARVALKSFAGRRVLLVFTKSEGHPWQQLLPELNRLQRQGSLQVLLRDRKGVRNRSDKSSEKLLAPFLDSHFLSCRPSSLPTLAGDGARPQLLDDAGQPGGTEGAAADLGDLHDSLRSESPGDRVDVLGHRLFSTFRASAGRWDRLFQRRAEAPPGG